METIINLNGVELILINDDWYTINTQEGEL